MGPCIQCCRRRKRRYDFVWHKSEQKDYYGALGVAKDATEKQIKKAYHKLSMVHHPDKVSGEAEKEAATKRFTEIGEAYGTSARTLQA